jgi:hypothetical protein
VVPQEIARAEPIAPGGLCKGPDVKRLDAPRETFRCKRCGRKKVR